MSCMGGPFFSGFACAIFEERPKDNADIVETKRFVGRAALPEGGGVGGGRGGWGVEVEQVYGTFDLSLLQVRKPVIDHNVPKEIGSGQIPK